VPDELPRAVLYVLIGCCWLPVLWLQWQMRDMARAATAGERPLPPRYFIFYRCWFLPGWPAFAGVLAILWLMIARPQ